MTAKINTLRPHLEQGFALLSIKQRTYENWKKAVLWAFLALLDKYSAFPVINIDIMENRCSLCEQFLDGFENEYTTCQNCPNSNIQSPWNCYHGLSNDLTRSVMDFTPSDMDMYGINFQEHKTIRTMRQRKKFIYKVFNGEIPFSKHPLRSGKFSICMFPNTK